MPYESPLPPRSIVFHSEPCPVPHEAESRLSPTKGISQCLLWISLLALAKGTARTWVRQAKPLKETLTLMCDTAQLSLSVSPGLPHQETGAGHSLLLPPYFRLQPCQVTGYQRRPFQDCRPPGLTSLSSPRHGNGFPLLLVSGGPSFP